MAGDTDPFIVDQATRPPSRYLLLEVPALDGTSHDQKSFVRLGAFPTDWAAQPGGHLLEMFPASEEFFDDYRTREGATDYREPAERQRWTQQLFTRGGWWDHSGGNRISTTEGDKLEVIRGNYRLIVLGRQDPTDESWDDAGGYDFSGGIIRDKQRLPGEVYREEWIPGEWGTGTWKVLSRTERGDTEHTFWGNSRSYEYGDDFDDHIGSEDDGDETPNPKIIKKTWAKSIDEQTGSAKKAVELLTSETWAQQINSQTYTLAQSESTMALTMESATNAGAITKFAATGKVTELELAGVKTNITILGASNAVNLVGASVEVGIVATAELAITLSAMKLGLHVGPTIGAEIGDHLDIELANTIGIQIGPKVDIAVRPGLNLDLLVAAKLDVFLGISIGISIVEINIGLNNSKIFGEKKFFGERLKLG